VRVVLANIFFIAGMLLIRNGADVGWFIVGLRQLKFRVREAKKKFLGGGGARAATSSQFY